MRAALALLPLPLLAACGDNMVQQARYDSYEKGPLFADGMAMQKPPAGVISRDAPQRAAAMRRPAMSLALVEHGRERYAIYCVPCHAQDGSGNGIVPSRGFPRPPDFHSDRLKAASERHFYLVMTQGYGVMYSYADRVSPPDRWAIAAYIRALQATGVPARARSSPSAFASSSRGGEADEAIHGRANRPGLLRSARNDEVEGRRTHLAPRERSRAD